MLNEIAETQHYFWGYFEIILFSPFYSGINWSEKLLVYFRFCCTFRFCWLQQEKCDPVLLFVHHVNFDRHPSGWMSVAIETGYRWKDPFRIKAIRWKSEFYIPPVSVRSKRRSATSQKWILHASTCLYRDRLLTRLGEAKILVVDRQYNDNISSSLSFST